MPGKTFAPTTQSMPLSSEEESHGLRRESHPTRVAFLLPANSGSGSSSRPPSPEGFDRLVLRLKGSRKRHSPQASTSAYQPRKKKPLSHRPQRLVDSIKPTRSTRNQERCTCTCFQLPASFCQIRVSQERAVTGSPSTGCSERCEYSTPASLIVCSNSWDEQLDQLSVFAM